MASCPTCNHDAEIGARFCSICGTVLPRRVCRFCGVANDIEAPRCVECGQTLRQTAPAPTPTSEDEGEHALGPMARLAELAARPPQASGPTAAAAMPPSALRPASSTSSTPTLVTRAEAPVQAAAAPSTAPWAPVEPNRQALPSAGTGEDAEAVDLYLDLARPSPAHAGPAPQQRSAEAMASPAPLTSAQMQMQPDLPLPLFEPAAPVVVAKPHRLLRFAPYAIGAAALGVAVVVAGGPWLWPPSSPRPTTSSVRTPEGRLPPQPESLSRDDPRRVVYPSVSPVPAAPAQAVPASGRPGASAAAPRRGDGVDAAADAALAAAERALATQGRPAAPSQRPVARPATPGASGARAAGTSPSPTAP